MPKSAKKTTTEKFEEALAKPRTEKYILRLYVTGMTPRSSQAIENIRARNGGVEEITCADFGQRQTEQQHQSCRGNDAFRVCQVELELGLPGAVSFVEFGLVGHCLPLCAR